MITGVLYKMCALVFNSHAGAMYITYTFNFSVFLFQDSIYGQYTEGWIEMCLKSQVNLLEKSFSM